MSLWCQLPFATRDVIRAFTVLFTSIARPHWLRAHKKRYAHVMFDLEAHTHMLFLFTHQCRPDLNYITLFTVGGAVTYAQEHTIPHLCRRKGHWTFAPPTRDPFSHLLDTITRDDAGWSFLMLPPDDIAVLWCHVARLTPRHSATGRRCRCARCEQPIGQHYYL